MEGEKEEKEEEEEEEEKELHPHVVAAASSVDYQDLPIMHWEDLSQRIAELEKQEQERRERAKRGTGLRTEERPGGVWRDVWQEEEQEEEGGGGGVRRCRVAVVTSRFHNHRNLQLCFINKSDSEDEEGSDTKVTSCLFLQEPAGLHGNRTQWLSRRWAETGSGHRSEDAERQTAGRAEGEGACGQQQWRCQAETSGALGAAGVFSSAAHRLERLTSTGRARSELGAGDSPAGTRPAEDEAGRHAAGRPGPDLTQHRVRGPGALQTQTRLSVTTLWEQAGGRVHAGVTSNLLIYGK
ncbi:uncharacterized protein im:7136398 isoform X1 [Scophthalmus maximus]|uniref:uncharacterized protein im:7136398 isoform X1 n=1 Tax=Scophthalmus maximus TaxID=52904 RepID=UPI001FA8F830|nr:uncharacterized protein im:7136398 isoform X1 [Scophthalmus maximus]